MRVKIFTTFGKEKRMEEEARELSHFLEAAIRHYG